MLEVASRLAQGYTEDDIMKELNANTKEEIQDAISELLFLNATEESIIYAEIDEDFFNGY
jgi:uncharacterized protein (DUF433 family)